MKNSVRSRIACVLSTVLMASCATTGETHRFYPGDARPPAEVETITAFHEMVLVPARRTEVGVSSIDGQKTESYNLALPSYEVLPGEHRLKVGYVLSVDGKEIRGTDPEDMVFTAAAGHRYKVRAHLPKTIQEGDVGISFWIEDMDSKKVIVAWRPAQTAHGVPPTSTGS